MKIEEIKELIHALEQSQLTCLEVSQGSERVRLEKNYTAAAPVIAPAAAPEPMVLSAEPAEVQRMLQQSLPQGTAVICPLVGVFYAAPSPEDAPYVTVGTQVKKGDVLCLVEAMKLMNEITAEKDGTVTQICAENGQVVEYGQPLFYLA